MHQGDGKVADGAIGIPLPSHRYSLTFCIPGSAAFQAA